MRNKHEHKFCSSQDDLDCIKRTADRIPLVFIYSPHFTLWVVAQLVPAALAAADASSDVFSL